MRRLPLALLIVLAFMADPNGAYAQGTAFTYQGELLSAGSPANGSFDVEFSLFNSASNGTQVGGTVTNLAVGVTNGLFTAGLDFGATPYNGQALWLQIGVRTNGSTGAFVSMAPLQPITSAPYAIQSANRLSGPCPIHNGSNPTQFRVDTRHQRACCPKLFQVPFDHLDVTSRNSDLQQGVRSQGFLRGGDSADHRLAECVGQHERSQPHLAAPPFGIILPVVGTDLP